MSEKTRIADLIELLYFVGNIRNNKFCLSISDSKNINKDFAIILSIKKGE